jgi:hypothetical protein
LDSRLAEPAYYSPKVPFLSEALDLVDSVRLSKFERFELLKNLCGMQFDCFSRMSDSFRFPKSIVAGFATWCFSVSIVLTKKEPAEREIVVTQSVVVAPIKFPLRQLVEVDFWAPLSPKSKPLLAPLACGVQRQAHEVRNGHQRFSGIEKTIADFNATPRKTVVIVGVVRMPRIPSLIPARGRSMCAN